MSITKTDLVTTRSAVKEDRNFILATFLRGVYYGDSWFKLIPKHIFMENYHTVVTRLLDTPGIDIKIACLKEDPEVILGYSIVRYINNSTVLDYVFVKAAWRRIGIAKSLMPAEFNFCTHLTKVGANIKPTNCSFNPFLL